MTNHTLLTSIVRQSLRVGLALAAGLLLFDAGSERIVLGQGGGCASPANPVVAENCLAGDTDWALANGADPSIQGYAADISVNRGQPVVFKVLTDATSYRIDIYRLGHYGGAGARKVDSVPVTLSQAQDQPACFNDLTTGLVDCGAWEPSASWNSGGATSGIYIAKLVRTDGGSTLSGENHMVFVLRDDARHSDLLMQTSDTTWQAYNRYGGASLYCGGPLSNSGTEYECLTRAAKVSYNRPFDTPDHDPRSWVLYAEHPMVRWLEANGYDVAYASGIDTDRFPAHLKDHKVFMSVGHDEYWSGAQRANVEAARDAGVNLAFFSGNEMFWKTRWEASADGSNTPYRTLVSYKETLANAKIDPTAEWTGAWRDPRFSPPADGGRPENAVTGTIWTVNCCSDALTVPYEASQNRFWRNTSIANLTPGTFATLSSDTLGYEWDEDIDNGSRPAGLTRLSMTTVDVPQKLVDFGSNVGPGTATHSLTLYRKNGVDTQGNPVTALVFGAGTVQWSWGLSGLHSVQASTPDARMQQATVNLLADMGAQPSSLQTGLVGAAASTDTTAPTASFTAPAAGASIPMGRHITVRGISSDVGGTVAGVEVSFDGGSSWHPVRSLGPAWSYDWVPAAVGPVTILSRAIDDSGNIGTPGAGVPVTVVNSDCPCSSLWNPDLTVPTVADSGDANAIEVGVRFRSDVPGFISGIRFYKSSANTGTHIGNLWTATGTPLATAVFTNETLTGWQEVRFASPVAISANTSYVASYHTNLGHYAADQSFFVNSVDSAPLHAPADSPTAHNGLFAYGASQFPGQTFHALNYWVDVIFAEASVDSSGPVISHIRATALDGSTALVTWDTDEASTSRVEYSTDASFPPAQTQSVSSSANVFQHSMTLSGLSFNTTYFLRLTSVDPSGNASVSTAPSLVVPGPTLHDTASVDFLNGAPMTVCDQNGQNCVATTYVAETGNGEVTLAPTVGNEFFGNTVTSGWIAHQWDVEGTATIGGGMLTVDGVRFGTCDVTPSGDCEAGIYSPRHTLEFYGTFTGDVFQHAGFGVKLEGAPWAIFSTGADGGLYARTNNGVDPESVTFLGPSLLGNPHRFRIDWNVTGVTYTVDGIVFATHAVAIAGPMRPIAASDFHPFGGNVTIDWIRMGPYAASGSFLSRIFDAASDVDWHTAAWTAVTPAGTGVTISMRSGSTPAPDGTWTDFAQIAPGPLNAHSRYIQYRADLTSSDPWSTPELTDILLTTDQAPVAVNDSVSTPLDTPYVFPPTGASSLTANDTDPDTAQTLLRVVAVTPPSHGTAVLSGNGLVMYTPASGFSGDDTFSYTVSDGLLSASATVHVRVGNVPPDADPQTVTTNEDTPVNVSLTASDADGDTLTIIVVTPPSHGSLSGTFPNLVFTPNANFNGSDSFVYKVSDGTVESQAATVTIVINSVNDAPVAVNDSASTPEDTAVSISVLANDTDADAGDTKAVASVTQGAHGSVAINGDGTVTYTPNANFNGVDTFTYVTRDTAGALSASGTVTVTVTAVNDAPVAGNDAYSVNEDTTLNTAAPGVLGNDSDVDSSSLTVAVVTGPSHGSLTLNADGSFSYTPAANYNGPDSFTYRASDGSAQSNVASVTITVNAVNDAPVAANDSYSVNEDATLNVAAPGLLGNDSDVDSSSLTVALVSNVSHGAMTLNADGSFTYTPAANYNGPDSFTYSVSDGLAQSNVATVTITVNPVNDAPVAVNDSYSVNEDATLNVAAPGLLGNDSDIDSSSLTVALVSNVSHGALTLNADGSFTYTPAANYNGADSFTYRANDGTANSGVATVSLTVNAVNDTPSFTKGANQSVANTAGAQTVANWATAISAGPADESAQTLNFIVSNSNNALFSVQPAISPTGTLTYTPASGQLGTATVTVQLHDNGGGADTSAAQTFTITLTGIPSLSIANSSVVEGNTGSTPFTVMPFTVTLSAAAAQTVTVSYATLPGTAQTPKDYQSKTGTLTFAIGETSKTININIVGDTTKENDETLTVRLSNPVNATIARADGIGMILDDDSTPRLAVTSTSVTEGNTGKKSMTFMVTPSNGNWQDMTVDYTTLAGDAAREGIDYDPVAGTAVIPAETTDPVFITVPVNGNTRHQRNHKVILRLGNAIGAIIDTPDTPGDIIDDDPAPSITIADVSVGEANSGSVNAVLTVQLSNDSDDVVTVDYSTGDGSAFAGADYLAQSGTLTFQPGVTSQVITVPVNAAAAGELNEWFTMNLSNATQSSISRGQATVTVIPPASWVTTTAAEFGQGSANAGILVANTSGGEVTLAPTAGSEFDGTALPAGWTSSVLSTGGSTVVANGVVTVDGTNVLSPTTYGPGHTLEFAATFSGQPNQSAGFGLTSALIAPAAVFVVKSDGLLYARSIAPGQLFETAIAGSWFNLSHQFRIDWNASTVTFWIDGTQKVTHTITYPAKSATMRPAIADQTAGGGAVSVAWMRMSAYAGSGIYTSPVYDAGAAGATMQSMNWLADLPTGTTVGVQIGTGDTATPDASWTWSTVTASGGSIGRVARYAQYKLTLTTTVPNSAPSVKEVVVNLQR